MADSPEPIATGDTLTYTITYSNTGTDVAAGTSVVVAYDPGVTFLSATPPPSVGTNTWDVGDLPVGGGGTIVVQVQVNAGPGSILNSQAVISETAGAPASPPPHPPGPNTPGVALRPPHLS